MISTSAVSLALIAAYLSVLFASVAISLTVGGTIEITRKNWTPAFVLSVGAAGLWASIYAIVFLSDQPVQNMIQKTLLEWLSWLIGWFSWLI
jgi:hypothetical protein